MFLGVKGGNLTPVQTDPNKYTQKRNIFGAHSAKIHASSGELCVHWKNQVNEKSTRGYQSYFRNENEN